MGVACLRCDCMRRSTATAIRAQGQHSMQQCDDPQLPTNLCARASRCGVELNWQEPPNPEKDKHAHGTPSDCVCVFRMGSE